MQGAKGRNLGNALGHTPALSELNSLPFWEIGLESGFAFGT